MDNVSLQILNRIANLNVYKKGDRRAPHKPLLILMALARLKRGQDSIAFTDAETALLPLLKAYAPPVTGRHQPELPYWHLQSDGIWIVQDAEELPRQAGGFPRMPALRQTVASFTRETATALINQEGLADQIVEILLEEHFPPSVHDDIIAAVGLESADDELQVREERASWKRKRQRNPAFRESVLRAYEHRCAVTGFRAALGGTYFGCEAAHVQWHAYGGPDVVANGISMEPTIHKLFDAGAWALTDDRRILVSAEFTGSDAAIVRLREHHGRPLRPPVTGEPQVAAEFINWHREPDLGGVFRTPALRL